MEERDFREPNRALGCFKRNDWEYFVLILLRSRGCPDLNLHRGETNRKSRDIGCAHQLPFGEKARVENLSNRLRSRRPEIAVGNLHLARTMVQIEILQNEAIESLKRISVRNHEHLGVAQDAENATTPPHPDECPKS